MAFNIPPVPSSITTPIERQFFDRLRKSIDEVNITATVGASGNYVAKTGDTMTGALVLGNLAGSGDALLAVDATGEISDSGKVISDITNNTFNIGTLTTNLNSLQLTVADNTSLINTISGDLDVLELTVSTLASTSGNYVLKAGDTMTGTLDVPTITLGLSGQDAYIYYDNEVVGSPALRYNSSTGAWQLSNEGSLFSDIQIKGGAGALSKANVTDNGDGTIDVDSINVILYSQSSWDGSIAEYVVPSATNLALTDDAVNYLCARYNGGNPEYYITTDDTDITDSDIVVVSRLYRHGFDIHHVENSWGLSTPSRLNRRFIEQQRYVRTSGLALSESTGRVIEIGAGVIWWGIEQFEETSVSSISGNCEFWYHSGGVWTHSNVSTYNNTHYDDGTDLVALVNNKYVTNWVFRFVNGDGLEQIAYVLGNDEYNGAVSSAAASEPILPPILESNAILVGRITVQKNATTASIIDSAFDSVYTGAIVTSHNDLSNLQGGSTSEYYHLTSSEHAEVQALSTTLSALSGTYVAKTGDTMTGELVLDGANLTCQKTGGPSSIYFNRQDGVIGAVGAGSSNTFMRFDNTGGLSIQSQPRADLEAQNGSNTVSVLGIDNSAITATEVNLIINAIDSTTVKPIQVYNESNQSFFLRQYQTNRWGINTSSGAGLSIGIKGQESIRIDSGGGAGGGIYTFASGADYNFIILGAGGQEDYNHDYGDNSHSFQGSMGFFGATPVSQPTTLTTAISSNAGASYTSTEQDIINNLQTRINELETKLQSLGLLG